VGSVMSCVEEKSPRNHVIVAAEKTAKEHSSASSSCTNFNVTTSPHSRSRLPAADAVNSSKDKNDVTQTLCERDAKRDISLSCSGFGMTLISNRRRRALIEDNKECEQASDVMHCSEWNNDVAKRVSNKVTNDTTTNKNYKQKKNDEAKEMSSFHMRLRPCTRRQYTVMAGKQSRRH